MFLTLQAVPSMPRHSASTLVPTSMPHPTSAPATQPEYHVLQNPAEEEGSEEGPLQDISSSSPDEAVVGTSVALALEDNRVLQQLLKSAAQSLAIQVEEIEVVVDLVVDILAPLGPSRVGLRLIKMIADTSCTLWQTPALLAPMAKKTERCYFVPSKGHEHLYTHPPPDSLVVDAANQRERQGFPGSTPKNREAKKLNLFGRQVYSTGGLQLCIANERAIVSWYSHNTCLSVSRFTELFPGNRIFCSGRGGEANFPGIPLSSPGCGRCSLPHVGNWAGHEAGSLASGLGPSICGPTDHPGPSL
ncbi:uncharacterized protein ACDP82_000767 [Pangshura tecta]